MEFKTSSTLVVEQQGQIVSFRVQRVSDSETFTELKLTASQAVDLASKLVVAAQKAAWHAG